MKQRTANTLERKLIAQGMPFREASFDAFLKELLNTSSINIERPSIHATIDDGLRSFIRRYIIGHQDIPIWLVQCETLTNEFEKTLLEHLRLHDRKFLLALGEEGKSTWRFGWVEAMNSTDSENAVRSGLMTIEPSCSRTWSSLMHPYQQAENHSMEAFQRCVSTRSLHQQLIQQIQHWKKYAIQHVKNSDQYQTTDLDDANIWQRYCNPLYLQVLTLVTLERKGWLGIQNDQWGNGQTNFLYSEWKRIEPRGENYWLSVLRPLLRKHGPFDSTLSRYSDKQFAHLNLRIVDAERLTERALSNDLFWHPQDGLLTILSAYPFQFIQTDHNTLYLTVESLRTLFEEGLFRGNRKTSIGYHTPPKASMTLVQQAIESQLFNCLESAKHNGEVTFEDLHEWIVDGNLNDNLKPHTHLLSDCLQNLRICDPSVGTGALLVAAVELITDLQGQLNHLDTSFIASDVKHALIHKSIFGVDTNPHAIEIAHLTLWLTWVVDREQPKPFLNLECNITQGNSLWDEPFGISTFDAPTFQPNATLESINSKFAPLMLELRSNLLNGITHYAYSERPTERLKEILDTQWKLTLLHVQSGLDDHSVKLLRLQHHAFCIWNLKFPQVFIHENPGFDIVLCHPPYILEDSNTTEKDNPYIQHSSLRKLLNSRMDAPSYFVQLGNQITNSTGSLCFLASNYIATNTSARKTRTLIKDTLHLTHWVNLEDNRLTASQFGLHNALFCARKKPNIEDRTLETATYGFAKNELQDWLNSNNAIPYNIQKTNSLFYGTNNTIRLIDQKWEEFFTLIETNSNQLGLVAGVHQGLVTGANQITDTLRSNFNLDATEDHGIFVLDAVYSYDRRLMEELHQETEQASNSSLYPDILKPLRKSSEVQRFCVAENVERYVLYLHKELEPVRPKTSVLWKHLHKFETLLGARAGLSASDPWWTLTWPRNPGIYTSDAIVTPYRSSKFRFALNERGYHYSSDCTLIVPVKHSTDSNIAPIDTAYLLGYLSSSLFECWYRLKGKYKGNMLEFLAGPLQEVPIPRLDPAIEQEIAEGTRKGIDQIEHGAFLDEQKRHDFIQNHIQRLDRIFYEALDMDATVQECIHTYLAEVSQTDKEG